MLEFLKVEEKATKSGKKLKKCMIEESGRQYPYNRVTVWEDHPEYAQIIPGYKTDKSHVHVEPQKPKFDGDTGYINPNNNKPYNNYTLYFGEKKATSTNNGGDDKVHAKLDAIYQILQTIGKKVGAPTAEQSIPGAELMDDDFPNPDDIPFS